jgi:tetratricopeptide (TPR) repeat protein
MEHKQRISVWYLLFIPLILALITAIIYYPSLHFAFQFDDQPNIIKHFNIRHSTFADLFFSGSRWISYWLNAVHYSIGKFDPFSYRVGNVIIHITNGMLLFALLYFLLSRLTPCGKIETKKQEVQPTNFFSSHALSIATLTSALFLMHPAHTQTVSYVIQGQLEGLATMSTLLIALLYLWHAHSRVKPVKFISAIMLLACAALACCTKEITIVVPILILLVDWFFIAQGDAIKLKSRAWLIGCITAIMGSLYVYFLKPAFIKSILTFNHEIANNIGNRLTENPGEKIKPFYFFISQFKVIVHYLAMYLWPFNMSVEYDWKLSKGVFAPDVILPFLALAAIGYCIYRILKKNPTSLIAFGALWFFVCVAPRSSFIPSSELLSDYKAYMASIGWLFILAIACIKIAELAARLLQKKGLDHRTYLPKGAASFIALLLVCLPLGIATKNQNMIWGSGLEFWGAMIRNAPEKARAYNNYGVELGQNMGKWKESIPYYKKAISMDRRYPDPCNNIAVAYAQIGDLDNAIKAIRETLKICPNYPEGYNNIGAFFLQKNDLDQAMANVKMALKLRPYYGKAHYNLGRIYLLQGKQEEAWQAFKDCCTKADMDTETGFNCYAQTSFILKKYDDTLFACSKALEINPRSESALFHRANSYYFLNRYEEAAQAYEVMLNYYPNDQRALFNAGETYLQLKNPQQALAYFEKCKAFPGNPQTIAQRVAICRNQLAQSNA